MRLKKKQKEALLSWISEGLQTDEINSRAALFKPPFDVSRQQVDFYRDSRKVDLMILQAAGEGDALSTGLAQRQERVKKLQQLAGLMERDLFGGFLWTDQVKSVGAGPGQKIVEYEEFNAAEVSAYRGVLDDIAKEVGDRRTTSTNLNYDMSSFSDDELARIAEGADPSQVIKDRKP